MSAGLPGFGWGSGSGEQALATLVRSPAALGNPGLTTEANISQGWGEVDIFSGSAPLKEHHHTILSQRLRDACAPQGRLGRGALSSPKLLSALAVGPESSRLGEAKFAAHWDRVTY